MRTPSGVYVASRASVPARGEMWRALRAAGWPISSSWIDEDGPGQTESMAGLWVRIEHEVAASSGLVLYAEASDLPLKGALVEVGMALAAGRWVGVVLILGDELLGAKIGPRAASLLGSWVHHPHVALLRTLDDAFLHASRGSDPVRLDPVPDWPISSRDAVVVPAGSRDTGLVQLGVPVSDVVTLTRDLYLTERFEAGSIRGPGRIYPCGWPVRIRDGGFSVDGDGALVPIDRTAG